MIGFDRTNLRAGGLWSGGCLALAAAIFLSLALSSSAVPAPKRTAKFVLGHFECYTVKTEGFKPVAVKLKDQFGSRAAKVVAPESLCNPVKKNTFAIPRKDAHLYCYRISTKRTTSRDVTATNQFGRLKLRVFAPYSLCLPSGKSETEEPQPIPPRLDHYQCYRVKPLAAYKRPSVLLSDQFWRTKAEVGTVYTLCNPVSKNGGTIVNKNDHLVCYLFKPSEQFESRRVVVSNQFEKATAVEAVAPRLLCLPSTKREGTTTTPPPPPPGQPDLTVQILPNAANPRISVSCAGGQGTCRTTVRFRITNAGAAAVGAGYQVRITADGAAAPVTKAGPGLAAGASVVDMQTLPPVGGGNNCYDPNCTVTVTVDSTNTVAESNEGNNFDTYTAQG